MCVKVSVLIDNIEDIEEDPETAQILCTYEGAYHNHTTALFELICIIL